MAAPLGSLLTYLPPARPPVRPPCNSLRCLCCSSPPRGTIGPYVPISVPSSLHKRVACSLVGKERERDSEGESERKARVDKECERDAGKPSWEQPSARRACQVAVYINFIADFWTPLSEQIPRARDCAAWCMPLRDVGSDDLSAR